MAGLKVDKSVLDELFEFYAERFAPGDKQRVLSVSYLVRKLFTPGENLGLARFMHALGKIKAALLAKGLKPDYIFMDINPETGRASGVPQTLIGRELFVKRVMDLNVPDLALKELESTAAFLSTSDAQGQSPSISLATFLHYIRKISTKDHYLLVQE